MIRDGKARSFVVGLAGSKSQCDCTMSLPCNVAFLVSSRNSRGAGRTCIQKRVVSALGQFESGCPALLAKIFSFRFFGNCSILPATRLNLEGRFANVTTRESGLRWTRMALRDVQRRCGRQSRVVRAPQRSEEHTSELQ